jgi:adenylate cyclase class IV
MERIYQNLWILKDPIETKKMISYEAKIKISLQDIEKIEERLKRLGFQKDEERLEKDITISSSSSDEYIFKIKEAENNESRILLVFIKNINERTKLTLLTKAPIQNIYGWVFEKLKETLEKERPAGIVITEIEKRRISFYNPNNMNSVTIDLDVLKKEGGQIIHLGNFLELTTHKENELDFLIQQFKDFGEVTYIHYYKMKNGFIQHLNLRD